MTEDAWQTIAPSVEGVRFTANDYAGRNLVEYWRKRARALEKESREHRKLNCVMFAHVEHLEDTKRTLLVTLCVLSLPALCLSLWEFGSGQYWPGMFATLWFGAFVFCAWWLDR